ncbi:MAG: hypothetical protein NC115_05915 [Bacteroidales bacterium]|nr:hypothetical protein [Bacteroidales bacterium]
MENNVDIMPEKATLKEYIEYLQTLKANLLNLAEATDGFRKVQEELANCQKDINAIMHGYVEVLTNISEQAQKVSETSKNVTDTVNAESGKSDGTHEESSSNVPSGNDTSSSEKVSPDAPETQPEKAEKSKEKELKEKSDFYKQEADEKIQYSLVYYDALIKHKKAEVELEKETARQKEEIQDKHNHNLKVKEKNLAEERIKMTQSTLNAIGTSTDGMAKMFNTFAKLYEDDAKTNSDYLKKQKNMQIAGATMEMLSGVVKAVSGAMSLGPIAGPIMGVINSATVIAAGVANIKKIKSTSTSGENSSSTSPTPMATVHAPELHTEVQTVHNITSSSEEAHLDNMVKDQKIYILSSDLEANGKRVKVQERETTF